MAAALCAAALLLSGCSDDPPEPKPIDPPTGSETTTAPPTSEPPKVESPEEVIREWSEASFQMQRTGETSDALALTDQCKPCNDLAELVEAVYADGGWIKPGRDKVTSIKKVGQLEPGQRFYQAHVQTPPWSILRSGGGKVERNPGGVTNVKFELAKQEGKWRISNYTVLV